MFWVFEVGQLYTDRRQYVSKLRAKSARLTALNRATSKASASRSVSSIAALTTFSTAQLETGSSLPIAKMRVPLTARWTSSSDTVLRSAAIVQPAATGANQAPVWRVRPRPPDHTQSRPRSPRAIAVPRSTAMPTLGLRRRRSRWRPAQCRSVGYAPKTYKPYTPQY